MDEDAGAVGADLTGAVEVRHHRDVGGAVEIGVGEDDQRRLAAQLHRHFLQGGTAGRRHHLAAGLDAAGEGDLLDTGMLGQHGAHAAVALDDVEDAVGQARFGVDLGQFQRAERCDFAGLEDHRVAGGQSRSRLPQGDLDRVVPGADPGDDAQRLAPCIDEGGGPQGDLLAFDGGDEAGVIFQHVGAGDDIDGLRFAERLAGVQRLQLGQFVVAGAQDFHGAAEDAGALHGGEPRPHALPFPSAGYGAVDIGGGCLLHLGQDFAGRGVDGGEGLRAIGWCRAAVDIKPLLSEPRHSALLVVNRPTVPVGHTHVNILYWTFNQKN